MVRISVIRGILTGAVMFIVPVLVVIWSAGALIMPVSGSSDDTISAYMGETINLHGFSYTSETVYLFLTGHNLPANGVPLNDISQRADQGAFTTVSVNDDQKWSYRWDTARLNGRLDYGTYTIYVVTDPVDLSHLAGHQYNTLTVDLNNPGISGVSISAGSSYTLNPRLHTSTPTSAATTQIPANQSPSQSGTPSVEATPLSPPPLTTATRKAGGNGDSLVAAGATMALYLMAVRRRA